MNILIVAFAAAGMCASSGAHAQYVKGNEAVQVAAGGKRVETPPVPASAGKPCGAHAKCHAGAWHMVETDHGLMECTEPYARPATCRASTYGSQKLPRLWIVKADGTWRWCQYPNLQSTCRSMFARPPANLPVDAIQ
jgi:hypothetical protein